MLKSYKYAEERAPKQKQKKVERYGPYKSNLPIKARVLNNINSLNDL